LPLDAPEEALRCALVPLEEAAARCLPTARLTGAGVRRARAGQALRPEDFSSAPPAEAAAWLSPEDRLVAIGAADAAGFSVLRGFVEPREKD
jgi:tRNA pseudouridine55 synthase